MDAGELVQYLDDYLCVRDVADYKLARNGLQVERMAPVHKVALAVDACQAVIDRAVADSVDMIIVHHGLFWGTIAPVTGAYYRRISALIKHDIGLYSSHLPLDVHPEVGNNHVLTRQLGLVPGERFGLFEGTEIGVLAAADLPLGEFVDRIRVTLRVQPLVIAAGPAQVRRVAVLTGGGGSLIGEAVHARADTYLTGEGAHHTFFDAEEAGINVIYAGHYATETVGVRALGDHLADRFGLSVQFIDHPTGL